MFHNGKPMTATDVAFSINRIVNGEPAGDGAGALSMVDTKNMKVIDKLTLQVPLTYAYSALPDSFAQYTNGIVPVGYDPNAPIGTGAFKYQSFTQASRACSSKMPTTGVPASHTWIR